MVYFTVASEGSTAGAIKRAYIPTVDDGSNNMGASIRLDIDYITTPDGIAVDWVGRCVVDTQVSRLARLCSFSPLASGELHHLQITERFFLHRVHIFFFILLPAVEIFTGQTPGCRGWRLPCWMDATGSISSRRTWDIRPLWLSTHDSGEISVTLVTLIR